MANARIWVFDVEHGFCAFIRSPNRRTLLIDCGRAEFFSPVVYLREHEMSQQELSSSRPLTKFVVSHPHDDHIQDIERVSQYFKPLVLSREVYNWPELEEPGGDYDHLHLYRVFQAEYNQPARNVDWGAMTVRQWGLTADQAKLVNLDKFVNNSSYIVTVEIGTFKMVFPGDIEKDGWLEMLKQRDFRDTLAGTDVFVASHHGHSSGYASEIFDAMGLSYFNLVSCRSRDESVESAYSSPDRARGVRTRSGETRYMFTTRNDGSCLLQVEEDGKFTYAFYDLPENFS